MDLGRLLSARYEGVVIDRQRNTLIQVSQPVRAARIARWVIAVVLSVLAGFIVGRVLDGLAALIVVLVACAVIFLVLYRTPAARIRYTSWTYPESYNLFEDELIRDRFATNRDEFTLLDG